MILCITPNLALDRTLVVPTLQPGEIARPSRTIAAAGGKGFNVARAIHRLGGQAQCAGFLGGHTGRLVADLARQEGLSGRWTWVENETRVCTIVIVNADGRVLEIYEPGEAVSADDWQRLQDDVLQMARQTDYVCLSGSLPPGCPADAPADLIRAIQTEGSAVWVDTSGAALKNALAAVPDGLKINATEASDILESPIKNIPQAVWAAATLRQQGIDTVVLTLGRQGAVLANQTGTWIAEPPPRQVVSAVGSGDAFFAGLITALEQGDSPAEMLRQAVATGTANALTSGGARFQLADVEIIGVETTIHQQ